MSLKAGRVGVASSEVDSKGKIKGSGSIDAYTKAQSDAKYETKDNIGGLKFRVSEGSAQYKTPDGDWANFSKGVEAEVIYTGGSTPFTTKEITADFTKYEYIVIEAVREAGSTILPKSYTMFKVSELKQFRSSYKPSIVALDYTREITSFNDSKLVLGNGHYGSSTGGSWCIPTKIWGVNGLNF